MRWLALYLAVHLPRVQLEVTPGAQRDQIAGVVAAAIRAEKQVLQAVDRAVARFGNPYALVHVAGGAGPKRARDIEDFQLPEWSQSST